MAHGMEFNKMLQNYVGMSSAAALLVCTHLCFAAPPQPPAPSPVITECAGCLETPEGTTPITDPDPSDVIPPGVALSQSTLYPGDTLHPGDLIISSDGLHALLMQPSGDLAVYNITNCPGLSEDITVCGKQTWHINEYASSSTSFSVATMQYDGNL